MALGKLLIDIGANVANFESDMGRAARIAKKESERIKNQIDVAMKAVAASAVAAGAGLATLVKTTANTADEIQKMSQRIGASTEFLSQMRLGADLTGVQFNTLTTGLQRMTRRLAEAAATGKGEAVPALEALGVSIKSIQNLAPEEQFKILADAMEGIESQGEKVRIAMKLFDTEGVALIQTMRGGSQAINEFQKQADRLGLTISQEMADASAEFNDQITIATSRIKGLAQSIGQSLIPAASEMIKQFNSNEVDQGVAKFDGLRVVFVELYAATQFANSAFATMGQAVGKLAAQVVQAFQLMTDFVEIFAKRVKLGALTIVETFVDDIKQKAKSLGADGILPDFIKDSSISQSASQLSAEISELEGAAVEATQAFNQQKLDDDFLDEATKRYQRVENAVDKVRKASIKTGSDIRNKLGKPMGELNDLLGGTNKEAEKARKELEKLQSEALRDFESVLQSLETPMEALNRTFAEQIESIGKYMLLNAESVDAQEKAREATERLTAEYLKNKAALEDTGKPYRDLLDSLDAEIFALGATYDQLTQLEAARLLEQAGINRSNTALDEYISKLDQVAEKLKQAASQQGTFGNGLNNFADLISDAFSAAGNGFEDIASGFRSMTRDAESLAEGLSSIGEFGADLVASFESGSSGRDTLGSIFGGINEVAASGALGPIAQAGAQIRQLIDGLTGGSLFGTAFSLESATSSFDINQSGASGFNETLETRRRSFFRGTARRRTQTDLDSDAQAVIDQLFDNLQVAIQNSALAVGGEAGSIIEGSFEQQFDANGNLTSQMSTILGRTFEESFEQFSQRLTAENILAGIGTVFDEVGQIADRWRGDAETLLDGAQFLLQAGADITSGVGLFESLTAVTTVITDLQNVGETLTEAYERVQGATLLFDDALSVIGQSFDIARVEYVRLAASIADAAGGLEQASGLWESYFETFYTEQELFEQSLNSALTNRDSLLDGIGVDSGIELDEFRQLFESQLPDLSADAIVEWLRAADAIGVVVDLESDLNEQREENSAQLREIIAGINSEIEDMGLSPFALRLKEIRGAFEQNIRTARELGASERELALIQTFAARQINQAIDDLENGIGSALTDLYGSELDRVNEQISLIESQSGGIATVQRASDNLYESQLRAIQNIQGFVRGLLLDEQLSPLNPQEQLAEAQSQFDSLLQQAQAGNVDALNELPALAQTLLGFGQDVFASSQDYVDIFNQVTESLSGLGVTADPVDQQQVIIGQNQRLIELQAERNRLEAEFDSQSRLDAARAIADELSELVSVTGESFTSLADRLGIPVESFLNDLGLSLDTLTVETTVALAETAQLLGVEVTDLANSVGLSLGGLADEQSLLNDALEQTIQGLPSGIADNLDALLKAIERSTDPQAREELLQVLNAAVNDLAPEFRDQLAPYLEDIDPITEAQQQVNIMDNISATNQTISQEVQELRNDENRRENETEAFQSRLLGAISDLSTQIQILNDDRGVA